MFSAHRWQSRVTGSLVVVAAALLTGCVGATINSGVGEKLLEHAPYYAGREVVSGQKIAYLPIAYQRGASQGALFDPKETAAPVQALLREMNHYLDSLQVGAIITTAPRGTAPNVMFGCIIENDECIKANKVLARDEPSMRLAVARPSGSWIKEAAAAMDEAQAEHLLLLTLEVGQYWPRQINWKGSKAIELGSDHAASLPWLTSLDAPINVLQITGALIGRDGKALRIGAEGLTARPTNIVLSGLLGAQEVFTDKDIEKVRTSQRDDLPGKPLVWQTALNSLIRELTGTPVAARVQ